MSELRVVLCTFPDAAVARQIGTVLVEKQYAACLNLLPAVESIYLWKSKVTEKGIKGIEKALPEATISWK